MLSCWKIDDRCHPIEDWFPDDQHRRGHRGLHAGLGYAFPTVLRCDVSLHGVAADFTEHFFFIGLL
ncbi:hypothetical protein ADK74_22010 [Streptomyces decoyicus]|nr:hypothetical protein ADK74_22010 [Streptomyces decoyicus]